MRLQDALVFKSRIMRQIFFLSTEHLENCLWFKDDEDFKVGMNFAAIQAASDPDVKVLAFILMSNHVHFVLWGWKQDAESFINQLKRRYSVYYQAKYGGRELLRRNKVDIKPIPDEDEAREKAIAYVQMNCVAANICSHPTQYPWGSGSVFFNPTPQGGRKLGAFSKRVLRKMLHTDAYTLPKDWMICEEAYILPSNYVAVKTVEAVFRTPKRMNFFLANSSKAKKRLESGEKSLPAFRDQVILACLPDLCRTLFGKESFKQLLKEEQAELLKQLRFRFSVDANQMARVCGLTYEEAARLLDSL